eukprot:Skav201960  [mRNA]  locus=scaffold103:213107:222009:- [translate_table: standard]
MDHMDWMDVVHNVMHVMDVVDMVLHVDRDRSWHWNSNDVRHVRHVLLLVLACSTGMDTAPALFFQRPLRVPLAETIFAIERLWLITATMQTATAPSLLVT